MKLRASVEPPAAVVPPARLLGTVYVEDWATLQEIAERPADEVMVTAWRRRADARSAWLVEHQVPRRRQCEVIPLRGAPQWRTPPVAARPGRRTPGDGRRPGAQ